MPYDVQVMLLRVLQEGTYMPVGATRERTSDVRVIAATNEDLQKAISEGRFREDLYHRLAGFEIRMPSLSECKEEILPLIDFCVDLYSKELKRDIKGISEEAEQWLLSYLWPGNIRELHHKTRRAVLMAESDILSAADFDLPPLPKIQELPPSLDFKVRYKVSTGTDTEEKQCLIEALLQSGGNLSEAARLLGISRPTLNKRLAKYGLK